MLATAKTPFVRRRGAIALEISSTVVRLAITHVAQEAGWYRCGHPARPCDCTPVTDRLTASDPTQVLVVRDAPADCQQAIESIVRGQARAVVLASQPEALHTVFTAMEHDSIVVPRRVADLAANAPRLNARLRTTLKMLAAGRTNQGIALAQHQSISTAKRDIAELFEIFDAPNRTALTRIAGALGFV